MAKKRKSVVPERLELKAKKAKKEIINPFERRFTQNEKHTVLNRKRSQGGKIDKLTTGKPGQSRARAIEKRKNTLLKEFQAKDKTNIFLDKRIGEKCNDMSHEQKMAARFAAEMKRGKKRKKFNLDDDDDIFAQGEEEVLTHFGKNLAEIEKFEDPRSDDEGDDDEAKLNSKFVDEIHFGGFMEKSDMEFASGKFDTRKEKIANVIADFRQKKVDKQNELQAMETMTKNADDKWKSMWTTIKPNMGSKKSLIEENSDVDPYDTLIKELGFEKEKKQLAKDRLKTEDEIVKEEKEKLEKLEEMRQKRMAGEEDINDVDDNEDEQSENEEDDEDESGEEEEDEDDFSDLEEDDDHEEEKSEKKKEKKKVEKKPDIATNIPYTFQVPNSYEELTSHLDAWPRPSDRKLVLERILKCNHVRLGEENREKLQKTFCTIAAVHQ